MKQLAKTVFLHIGTHKTGTTALQRTLYMHDRLLAKAGWRFYNGIVRTSNHRELSLAAMREGRGASERFATGYMPTSQYRPYVRAYVRSFIAACPIQRLIFSNEGLCYLRHPDEIDFLRSLFLNCEVKVIVYLRDPAAFLASYRAMNDRRGIAPSSDPTSFAYVESDSWLVDYASLIGAYRAGFGDEAVIVRSYEEDKASMGGTVGSFLSLLGLSEKQRAFMGEKTINVAASLNDRKGGTSASQSKSPGADQIGPALRQSVSNQDRG